MRPQHALALRVMLKHIRRSIPARHRKVRRHMKLLRRELKRWERRS